MLRNLAAASLLALAAGHALADDIGNIKVFGQWYAAQRFDIAAELEWDNPSLPGFTIQMIESEGIAFRNNNEVFFSTSEGGIFGAPANLIIKAALQLDLDGKVTGLNYVSTVIANDPLSGPFDLNPNGVALNGATTGIAPGGLLVADGENLVVRGYSLAGVYDNGFSVFPSNENMEDLVYVAPRNEIWTVRQEPAPAQIVRFTPAGVKTGEFSIANTSNPATLGEAKGVAFFPPSPRNPAFFDALTDGYILVGLDDNQPGLQAFDLDGNELGLEPLTVDGTPLGVSRLDLAGYAGQLQIESLTVDPATGRLFLNSQGDGFAGNFLFILTPYCRADVSLDGSVDLVDFFEFLNAFDAGDPNVADLNGDNSVDLVDFFEFLNRFDASC